MLHRPTRTPRAPRPRNIARTMIIMTHVIVGDPSIFLHETEIGEDGAISMALISFGVDVVSTAPEGEPPSAHLEEPLRQERDFPDARDTIQTSHIDSVHGFANQFRFAAFICPIAPLTRRTIDQRRSMEPMTIMEVVIIGRPMDRNNIPPRMSYIQGGKRFIQS